MPKGMVITVGVGGGIEHAIALSIRNSNPDHIVFLVTEQSEKTLEKIEQEAKGLGITLPPYETERIRDENDAELAYEAAVSAIRKLGEKISHQATSPLTTPQAANRCQQVLFMLPSWKGALKLFMSQDSAIKTDE